MSDHGEAEEAQSLGETNGLRANVESWAWRPEVKPRDPSRRA